MHEKSLNWLHISDMHIKAPDDYQRDRVLNALVESLPNLIRRYGAPDVIFVTGDIAFSGKDTEYAQATRFFDKLLAITSLNKSDLFIIPGNHDVDRSKGKGLARTIRTEESDSYFDPTEELPHLRQRQGGFLRWFNEYFDTVHCFPANSTCLVTQTRQIKGVDLIIASVNSATFSLDDNDHGKLWVGSRSVDALKSFHDKSALKIVLIHHPFDWLATGEQSKVKTTIRSFADVILSGHLHENNAEQIVGVHSDSVIHLAAGAAYQTEKWPNTAMFCRYDGENLIVNPIKYSSTPTEVWVTDPSIFPDTEDFSKRFSLANHHTSTVIANVSNPAAGPVSTSIVGPALTAAQLEFEQDLFNTPLGRRLYAEPRLMRISQESHEPSQKVSERVPVADIVSSDQSFLIEAKPEYGATSLSKRLAFEIINQGGRALRKDARRLPTYKKKLEEEFEQVTGSPATLILDNLSLEADERLIKEIRATNRFVRIIGITVARGITSSIQPQILGEDAIRLHLWPMARDDIRGLACEVFSTGDQVFISKIVDKVYADLLALCIPLTAPTVIMYLRVLHREGEFHPLNRVDILARYLDEVLRKPSDAYAEAFNPKNKLDVVSLFVFDLYTRRVSVFDDRDWHEFIHNLKNRTLTEFNGKDLLDDMLSARVFQRFGDKISLKYSFFHDFLLGKHLASRSLALQSFLDKEDYLSRPAVIDVISGLSSDNDLLVRHLSSKMKVYLDQWSEKYFDETFDPLKTAIWPDSSEDENLWASVAAEIEKAPRQVVEIDAIKTSLIDEARTADQRVRYQEFTKLEKDVFVTSRTLTDALINSQDVDGDVKLAALDGIFKGHLVSFQVGCMLAPVLARNSYLKWGGIAFLDFDTVTKDEDEAQTITNVTVALALSIGVTVGEILGSPKMAAIFNARRLKQGSGILELMNFHCILRAKGGAWTDALADIIKRIDKNAYYLSLMLTSLMHHLETEVLQTRDRESIKRLVATIQAKRTEKKQVPGSKLVRRMLDRMEEQDQFVIPPPETK